MDWILKLMSALETATNFFFKIYILQLIPTFYGLCLQTQISNEAYVIHFNLQHCLNQALLVISLWENPCQLLLLRKKLVAERKMIYPIIQSIIQVKIYRIKTMLLSNMFNTMEERCDQKSLDNM